MAVVVPVGLVSVPHDTDRAVPVVCGLDPQVERTVIPRGVPG
ncbi:MAG: hypothetical protein JWN31_757 [Frankiales bacterium]|nr:hypothetical protein [Frankiales bacterium]